MSIDQHKSRIHKPRQIDLLVKHKSAWWPQNGQNKISAYTDAVIHDSQTGTNFYVFPMTGVVPAAAVQLPKMTGSKGR